MIYKEMPEEFDPVFEVVSCYMEHDGRILLLHRHGYKSEGGRWGLPAGKIDEGENHHQAMVREIEEETGHKITSDKLDYLDKVYVKYPDYDFVYYMFRTKLDELPEVKISASEHQGHCWVEPAAAKDLNLVMGLDTCIDISYGFLPETAVDQVIQELVVSGLDILLIDNGSDNIRGYLELLRGHKVDIVPFKDIRSVNPNEYQLLILSDGTALNIYKNLEEINMVRAAAIPVIGISYGFQLLCMAYGAELAGLPFRREGLTEITPAAGHPVFSGLESFQAWERHRFSVRSIPVSLACLAKSSDGCEIVQVRGKEQYGFQFRPDNDNDKNAGREIFNNLIKYIFGKKNS